VHVHIKWAAAGACSRGAASPHDRARARQQFDQRYRGLLKLLAEPLESVDGVLGGHGVSPFVNPFGDGSRRMTP
jgi:hypothetical protein